MTTSPRRQRTTTLAATALAALALGLTTAAPASAEELRPTAPDPLPAGAQLVLDRTNDARATAGCGPLAVAEAMTDTAAGHSAEMAAGGRMSHVGADGSTPRVRLAAHGVQPWRTAENVAYGYDAASVVDAWLASPGHRANILDCRLTHVGIAEAPSPVGPYWTQVLAGF
ncbi:CAP domain-containing protein [Paenibacillus sp. TRM 82003]|uniref:CAP domain-containing protein n=1 Tax=Kineococcus sp. TRM81007 TaxID=2925831 RepID=UPI001F5AB230|nr:CAP domain-containing protein [Kineococcus sp. TRM81007]MCI2239589.1 CAP domain-containing protein [Kineococcus sp. TRM81007]MCI3926129.1 CAP domain-containing protein [Paenibacillus sp. TRM 82003]